MLQTVLTIIKSNKTQFENRGAPHFVENHSVECSFQSECSFHLNTIFGRKKCQNGTINRNFLKQIATLGQLFYPNLANNPSLSRLIVFIFHNNRSVKIY